jgi:hypothetical protein
LLILLMLLQQIEWFDATMLVQWSIQIYRTFYIIWLYESLIVCNIYTPHMFEYHPQSQQNDCSFAAPSPSSSSSGTDIVEWWWVFCCATEILTQSVLQMYTFFFLFLFWVWCLLICLFGPSARFLPERKVLQTKGKDQCWRSSLLLWKTSHSNSTK